MARLNFNLKKTTNGQFQVYAIITENWKRLRKFTGITIETSKEWDTKKQRMKSGHDKATLVNKLLNEKERLFGEYIDNCLRFNKQASLHEIHAAMNGEQLNVGACKLVDAFSNYLRYIEHTHTAPSKGKYRMMKQQIERYEDNRNKSVYLEEVTDEFYLDLVDFLLKEQNNGNRTILRKLKYIRTVMQHMVDKGLFTGYAWKAQSKLKETKTASRVPLTQSERQALWDYQTINPEKRMIVDAFILAMYTGLRFGDLEQLAAVHIHQLEDCHWVINLSLEKGNKEHMVGIPDFVYERIKKYIRPKGLLFNLPENGSANRTLQRISRTLGLDRQIEWKELKGNKMVKKIHPLYEKISFHFARYTFTRMMDDCGLQATDIQKNLRHSRFSTTEGYLKSDDHRRIRESNSRLAI